MSETLKINTYNEEMGPYIEKDRVIENIFDQLKNSAVKLGFGKTAEVFFFESIGKSMCMKVIAEERLRTLYQNSYDFPAHNRVFDEADFLSRLCQVSENVIIPEPIQARMDRDDQLGDTEILIMQKLNAVTIQDILYKQAELPLNFDFQKFSLHLKAFIKLMNEELQIHHRDLSETNIMIDLETGKPCVIDFGDAYRTSGEGDDPYKNGKYMRDSARVKTVLESLKNFISNRQINNIQP